MRDAKKHVVPAGSDPRTRADLTRLSLSAHTIVPVGGQTERDQVTTDLTAAGYGPSLTDPLYVHRLDLNQVEVNTGSGWSRFLSKHYDSGTVQLNAQPAFEKVVLWCRKVNNTVAFTGSIRLGAQAGQGTGTLCTIPAGMPPPVQYQLPAIVQGTKDVASVTIAASGTVTMTYLATVTPTGLFVFGGSWVVA